MLIYWYIEVRHIKKITLFCCWSCIKREKVLFERWKQTMKRGEIKNKLYTPTSYGWKHEKEVARPEEQKEGWNRTTVCSVSTEDSDTTQGGNDASRFWFKRLFVKSDLFLPPKRKTSVVSPFNTLYSRISPCTVRRMFPTEAASEIVFSRLPMMKMTFQTSAFCK